jgi:hypothetical protein
MMNPDDYDDIRPYNDSEIPEKIKLLLDDPVFGKVMKVIFPEPDTENYVRSQLRNVRSVEQLQRTFVYQIVEKVINSTTKGLTVSGLDYLDKSKAYLFFSNHRDIILDSAFLNYNIFRYGMNTTQIAIGDNLLIYDWITQVVKMNRTFVVKRQLSARELLKASITLSSYIRGSITENNLSVWIAQREGRTKDGNDKTQVALLKMLNLSNDKNLADGFSELTLIPLSISYEIEPCGIAKVSEMIKKSTIGGYKKTPGDDLMSMASGFSEPKGRVNFSFGRPILRSFLESINDLPPNEFLLELSKRIDHRIHQYYRLWPFNYVAYDMMNGTGEFTEYYTANDIVEFKKMITAAQNAISYKSEEVARRFTLMYARPVENSIIAAEIFRT